MKVELEYPFQLTEILYIPKFDSDVNLAEQKGISIIGMDNMGLAVRAALDS